MHACLPSCPSSGYSLHNRRPFLQRREREPAGGVRAALPYEHDEISSTSNGSLTTRGPNMGALLNNNSAVILVGMLLVALGWYAWDYRRSKRALAVFAAVAIVLVGGYLSTRHGPSDVASLAEVDAVLAAGVPVILQVYSDN